MKPYGSIGQSCTHVGRKAPRCCLICRTAPKAWRYEVPR